LEPIPDDPLIVLANITLQLIVNPITFAEVIGFVTIGILLFCSACISASEVAFFSLSPSQINDIQKQVDKKDEKTHFFLERPNQLLATILIANNFINIGIVVLSTFVINKIFTFHEGFIIAFFIQVIAVTALILFFGEIVPKVYAAKYPQKIARFMTTPLTILNSIFTPLSFLLVSSTRYFDKRISKKGIDITMTDLSNAIEITRDDNNIEEDEEKMLKGIVRFGNIDVSEVMTSRMDVVAVDSSVSYNKLLDIIQECGYSRIPVYKESFDNIEGILYVKDLLKHLDESENFPWQTLLRKAFFVPENKKLNDLLREFQEKKIHLAIVVDEYGGTQGIITLEDIIEEIVGDINDEFDTEESIFTKIDNFTYIFEAKTQLNDFCKTLGLPDDLFDDVKGESESIAGLILEIKGDIPEKGEEFVCKKIKFSIDLVDARRIKRVKIVLPSAKPA